MNLTQLLNKGIIGELVFLQYVIGGLSLAVAMSFGPAISQPYVKKLVGRNRVAVGHFNSVGYLIY